MQRQGQVHLSHFYRWRKANNKKMGQMDLSLALHGFKGGVWLA
jgi:hypothetical protein